MCVFINIFIDIEVLIDIEIKVEMKWLHKQIELKNDLMLFTYFSV